MRVGSFWSGAMTFARRGELSRLSSLYGVLSPDADLSMGDLLHAGIPRARAEAWSRSLPKHTAGRAVVYGSAAYPRLLARCERPPPVLFVEGDAHVLQRQCVAIVGTRRCSAYGAAMARELAHHFARAGIVVVSGLAWGIDGHAHRSALEVGHTVGVLGHGLSTTSPRRHESLRRALVDRGGAVVTTWHDDVLPQRYTFPQRNRWIAALARLVVVVEAPVRSGALLTAREAATLGVDVAAVPGRSGDARCGGCLQLLAEGADLVEEPRAFVARVLHTVEPPSEAAWMTALMSDASVSHVARIAGWSVTALLVKLGEMERGGQIKRLPDGRYARC